MGGVFGILASSVLTSFRLPAAVALESALRCTLVGDSSLNQTHAKSSPRKTAHTLAIQRQPLSTRRQQLGRAAGVCLGEAMLGAGAWPVACGARCGARADDPS